LRFYERELTIGASRAADCVFNERDLTIAPHGGRLRFYALDLTIAPHGGRLRF